MEEGEKETSRAEEEAGGATEPFVSRIGDGDLCVGWRIVDSAINSAQLWVDVIPEQSERFALCARPHLIKFLFKHK